jgi:hypothetical protein
LHISVLGLPKLQKWEGLTNGGYCVAGVAIIAGSRIDTVVVGRSNPYARIPATICLEARKVRFDNGGVQLIDAVVGRSINSAPLEMIKDFFGVCLVSIIGEHQRDYRESERL